MKRTFIWGGCIARDTFELLPDEYDLAAYIARQSWLSVGRPSSRKEVGHLTSRFQRRMALGDVAGNALDRLDESLPVDLVLLDLCVERLGVVDIGSGVLTRSVEKMRTGVQEILDAEGVVTPFGEERHLQRWTAAAESVRDHLERCGLMDKTLVLAPAWAFFDDNAQPMPTSFGLTSLEMNEKYERYYAVLEDLGFSVLRVDPTLGASKHKWGRAPFHYHETTYQHMAEAIVEFAEGATRADGSAPSVAHPS